MSDNNRPKLFQSNRSMGMASVGDSKEVSMADASESMMDVRRVDDSMMSGGTEVLMGSVNEMGESSRKSHLSMASVNNQSAYTSGVVTRVLDDFSSDDSNDLQKEVLNEEEEFTDGYKMMEPIEEKTMQLTKNIDVIAENEEEEDINRQSREITKQVTTEKEGTLSEESGTPDKNSETHKQES